MVSKEITVLPCIPLHRGADSLIGVDGSDMIKLKSTACIPNTSMVREYEYQQQARGVHRVHGLQCISLLFCISLCFNIFPDAIDADENSKQTLHYPLRCDMLTKSGNPVWTLTQTAPTLATSHSEVKSTVLMEGQRAAVHAHGVWWSTRISSGYINSSSWRTSNESTTSATSASLALQSRQVIKASFI